MNWDTHYFSAVHIWLHPVLIGTDGGTRVLRPNDELSMKPGIWELLDEFRSTSTPLRALDRLRRKGTAWRAVTRREFGKLIRQLVGKGYLLEPPVSLGDRSSMPIPTVRTWADPAVIHYAPGVFPDETVRIGKYCTIADGVRFFLRSMSAGHDLGAVTLCDHLYARGNLKRYERFSGRKGITVGNDVWIGSHAVIMAGVTIGDGAAVSAYSLIAQKVRPYAIVGGNPAQVLGFRFRPEIVTALLKIKWWDWSPAKIEKNRDLLTGEPKAFIRAHLKDRTR